MTKPKEKVNVRDRINDYLSAMDASALYLDGFDEAIIGVVNRFTQSPLVLYDEKKCIKILMKQGMTQDEAEEYFEFNVIGAWVGDMTPYFMVSLKDM